MRVAHFHKRRSASNVDDNLRDSDGYVAAGNGDVVHAVRLYPHSATNRRRRPIDPINTGAKSPVTPWQGD